MRVCSVFGSVGTLAVSAVLLCLPQVASAAVTLVKTSDPGFYNHAIGNALNLSNPGGDTSAQPFPVSDDSDVTFGSAPDLSAASGALGNWLTDPQNLNSNWNFLASIPNSWDVGTEVAVIYQFNTLGATNVNAAFGVDNGIFVYLDGTYLFGARAAGGVIPGEYSVPIGDLTAGTHYLQLLLEDHGATNGYDVDITADTFIPGLPSGVPEPMTLSLFGAGLAGLFVRRRRSTKA